LRKQGDLLLCGANGISASNEAAGACLKILRAARPDQQFVFQLGEAPLVAFWYDITESQLSIFGIIWRESLHGIWHMFHLPEEGKCAVQRSSSGDFIATADVRGTYSTRRITPNSVQKSTPDNLQTYRILPGIIPA